uniref:RRM domain-containing protein n=2 Tax=Leersia perrieri TaxID=77586 RepID=A0A0D9X0U7_9ORYZ
MLYLEPQFQFLNTPVDYYMPMDSLNAQVNVLGSGVPEMYNQWQSHPLGSQWDFLPYSLMDDGSTPEHNIYITFREPSSGSRVSWKDVKDYFMKFGTVTNVNIRYKPEPMNYRFGSVTFKDADTVRHFLSTPRYHSVCGTEVRIKPYMERTERLQRKLAQKKHHIDNVAHRTSCANATEGHSGEKLPSYDELSQEVLKLQLCEECDITNTIAPETDLPTHNLSEKEAKSPEGSIIFQMTLVYIEKQ